MKFIINLSDTRLQQIGRTLRLSIKTFLLLLFTLAAFQLSAQNEEDTKKKEKPVRSMFESSWLIDNQSVVVPVKGTFQMDILHRFGVMGNGYDDFYGFFAPSNIKLGFTYTVIDNLAVGIGLTKENNTLDFNAKYAIVQQTRSGSFPISITYFGNAAIDTRDKGNFINGSDRMSYFHQLIIARKVTDAFSIQIAPSVSHFNAVEGYISPELTIEPTMKNDHYALSVGGRYKVKDNMAIIANYDQPLTEHLTNNPNPNISFGIEVSTSSHAFQIFMGNYRSIVPQRNNVFNSNNPTVDEGENFGDNYLIGFNITRLWNW